MEYPFNVETALAVEKCIRENGAIPATIAIIKGRIKVLFVLIFYNFILIIFYFNRFFRDIIKLNGLRNSSFKKTNLKQRSETKNVLKCCQVHEISSVLF